MIVRAWGCGNCGEKVEATTEALLHALRWQQVAPDTVRIVCPGCGSYTLCRSWDSQHTAGEFLVVKSFTKGGKGNGRNNAARLPGY